MKQPLIFTGEYGYYLLTGKNKTMEKIIKDLYNTMGDINTERLGTNTQGKDHGSADQTRGILLETIFYDCMNDMQKIIDRLKILERELY